MGAFLEKGSGPCGADVPGPDTDQRDNIDSGDMITPGIVEPGHGGAVATALWYSEDGYSDSHILTVSLTGKLYCTWLRHRGNDRPSGHNDVHSETTLVGNTVAAVGAGLESLGVSLGLKRNSTEDKAASNHSSEREMLTKWQP